MWIIDANNVLGARPDGWWRDRPRALARLVDAIATWRPPDAEVVVVVDGDPTPQLPEGPHRGVEVRYAQRRGPNAADHAIVGLLAAMDDPTGVTVVTSDGWLRSRARELGAAVEGAGTFRARIDPAE